MFDREYHLCRRCLIDLTFDLLDFLHHLLFLTALRRLGRGCLLGHLLGSATGLQGEVRLLRVTLERGFVKEGDLEGVPGDVE
jgi:hypothetical protein